MAVVGNLFVNIAAKTSQFSAGIGGVVRQLQALPIAGRISAAALGGLMAFEFGRIARQAMFRFAETQQSIYSITRTFREFELSAARSIAPVLNVLTKLVEVKLKAWTEESAGGVNSLGTTFGALGQIVQSTINGIDVIVRGLAVSIAAIQTATSAFLESIAFGFSFGASGFDKTKEWAAATQDMSKGLMSTVAQIGQQDSAFEAGMTGKVGGRQLTETGVMGSEERLMIARAQLQALKSIEAKVGGVN